MNESIFSNDQQGLIIFALNHFGSLGPVADEANLKFFSETAIREAVTLSKRVLNEHGALVAEIVLGKLS
jgi:hypothetical protein